MGIFSWHRSQSVAAEPADSYLLVGLGNPGREYRETRHNVGFMVIDRLGEKLQVRLSKLQSKALIGSGIIDGKKVFLAKPQTFMNLSGQAISSLMRFYKLPISHLLVIHDDLDLPVGTLRMRPGGSSAGQKGLESTIQQLGTQEFPRLRIGIGRPPGQKGGANYVLQEFSASEQDLLTPTLDKAAEAAQVFIKLGLDAAMNQYNGAIDREK